MKINKSHVSLLGNHKTKENLQFFTFLTRTTLFNLPLIQFSPHLSKIVGNMLQI